MILECEGYRRLVAAVEEDERKSPGFHDYRGKLDWIVSRANHYAEKTGLSAETILDAWESQRTFWYMNYYQDCRQPEITGHKVRVFETTEQLRESIGTKGFRCPHCSGIATNPYECNSGIELPLMNSGGVPKPCNWKAFGVFGSLGKGVSVFVKSVLRVDNIFMPIAWEQSEVPA